MTYVIATAGQAAAVGAAVVAGGLTPVHGGSLLAFVLAAVGLVILTIAKGRMRDDA